MARMEVAATLTHIPRNGIPPSSGRHRLTFGGASKSQRAPARRCAGLLIVSHNVSLVLIR